MPSFWPKAGHVLGICTKNVKIFGNLHAFFTNVTGKL